MPRYLRWIAALTTAVTVQFAYFILIGAIAVGTDNTELSGGIGVLVTFGQIIVGVIPALAVNEWLAKRYPGPAAPDPAAQDEDAHARS